MYFGQKNGIEVSAFVGVDFNTENEDTDYRSGTQFHVDGTLAQHFPLLGGLAGVGVSAYYYQQVTETAGPVRRWAISRARRSAPGPSSRTSTKIWGHDTIFELKWLHEVETENRLEGDIVWLKAVYKF